jgi:hypothetical protein
MEDRITEKVLIVNGFVKKMNMWKGLGIWVSLYKGHTWMCSKANSSSVEVKTIQDIKRYVDYPPIYTTSKVAF